MWVSSKGLVVNIWTIFCFTALLISLELLGCFNNASIYFGNHFMISDWQLILSLIWYMLVFDNLRLGNLDMAFHNMLHAILIVQNHVTLA